ncbi:polysaccharide biosynthesis/export family protein [Geothrix sp. 21YS21S-2]|uniref:polysaccharide biosynthesis/export family protein n=1 Tax=Geothrix sp. 21YS21S-2 TaxID=3068893 RepID=UPI0027B8AD82|nr:polysaccharide biosynthesis/export family protein [Geothrix sp. 21YS21S-2]
MLRTLGHAQVPSSIPVRVAPLRFRLGLGLLALTLLAGCQAPGMKLTSRPNSHERPEDVGGLAVTLHPVSPELVNRQAARPAVPVDLSALVSDRAQVYHVGSQDVLLVTVWDHPEISLPMGPNRTDTSYGNLVDEEGYIFFPYVGKLKVQGMTISQVRDALTTQLAKSLRNPQVDVKVLVYRSQKVYVGGEVRNPAIYPVTDVPFTLAEAINRAGGLLPAADDSRMVLTRGSKSWMLNFQALMAMGNASGQILLQDGDSLQIPNASEEPVYLMGELMRPGNIPLVHGKLSLAKAISEVGGIQVSSADATSIYVIRSAGAANKVDVFHLDARNPASMILADKFALNPRDIVYVDAGTLVRFSRVMNLLMPTINAVTAGASTGAQVYYFKKRL